MQRRTHARGWPPKGSYPHPAGGHILEGPIKPGQQIRIVAQLKKEPDLKVLARAYFELAKQLAIQDGASQVPRNRAAKHSKV